MADPEEIADRLHSASIHLLRKLRREDAASGLSAAQLSALSVVVFAGPLSMGELASAEQVSGATMSRLVDGLERLGLVRRESDAADRRVIRVVSTGLGDRILREGRSRRVRVLAEQLRTLDEGDLAVVERTVSLLEGLLRK